ncbi:MAG: methylmalonyl Co-A mutase-associated GTPase MeaB, partial [Flavobacterium macrobrachii]
MKKDQNKSALKEIDGIPQPEILNASSVQKVLLKRKNQPSAKELIAGILAQDKVALSRAITLVESTNLDHLVKANEIINGCLPHANKSIRIGITGVPGVGKSTFIEAFGKHLTSMGKKVAVLAV